MKYIKLIAIAGALLVGSLLIAPTGAQVVVNNQPYISSSGVASGPLGLPDGTAAAPALYFTADPALGFRRTASSSIYVGNNVSATDFGVGPLGGSNGIKINGGGTSGVIMAALSKLAWTLGTEQNTQDTSLSRSAAGVVAVGTGAQGSFAGSLKATSYTAVAGAGTGLFKSSGVICDTIAGTCSCSAYSSSNVINQWNVITCSLPASTLSATGDELTITSDFLLSNNANTKELQMYFSSTACGGTGAAMCTGTQLGNITTASQSNSSTMSMKVIKTGSNTQNLFGLIRASTAFLQQQAQTGAITDTGAIQIAIGCRNTTASAACSDAPTPQMTIRYYPQ